MGILDDQNTVIVPPASMAANALIAEARDVWNRMNASFTEGAKFFWRHPDGISPQEIADAMGTAGVEVFSLHARLGQLIASVSPDAVSEGMSYVGEVSYADDGTVTVTPPPEPTPPPGPSPDPEPEPPA